jgi:hypothetical protein
MKVPKRIKALDIARIVMEFTGDKGAFPTMIYELT